MPPEVASQTVHPEIGQCRLDVFQVVKKENIYM